MAVVSNSTTDYLRLSVEPSYESHSCCFWFQSNAGNSGAALSGFSLANGAGWLQAYFTNNNNLRVAGGDGDGSDMPISQDTWYFCAINNDGAGIAPMTIRISGVNSDVWDDSSAGAESGGHSETEYSILGNAQWSEGGSFTLAAFKCWTTSISAAELLAEKWQYVPKRMEGISVFSPFLGTGVGGSDFINYAGPVTWSEGGTVTRADGPPIIWDAKPAIWVPRSPAAAGEDHDITLPREALEVSGNPPGIRTSELGAVDLPREQLTLTGRAPSVEAQLNARVGIPREQLTLTGRAPGILAEENDRIILPREALTLTGRAPSVEAELNARVSTPREQLTLTGRAPGVEVQGNVDIALPREQLTLTGRAPVSTIPNDDNIAVPREPLTLTARAPGTRTSELGAVDLPREQLTLTGRAPGVVAEGTANVQLGRAQLTLTGRAPVATAGEDHDVTLPREQLTLTGRAPSVEATLNANVSLPAARLQANTSAPNTYLAGDKNTAAPSARLNVRGLFVRVRTTTPDDVESGDTGVISNLVDDVAVPPVSPRIG